MMEQALRYTQELIKDEFWVRTVITEHDLPEDTTHFRAHLTSIGQNLALSLHSHIYGERIRDITFPSDWWQAFKARWFPGWLLRRFPVRYQVWEVKRLYPDFTDPQLGRAVSKPIHKPCG